MQCSHLSVVSKLVLHGSILLKVVASYSIVLLDHGLSQKPISFRP